MLMVTPTRSFRKKAAACPLRLESTELPRRLLGEGQPGARAAPFASLGGQGRLAVGANRGGGLRWGRRSRPAGRNGGGGGRPGPPCPPPAAHKTRRRSAVESRTFSRPGDWSQPVALPAQETELASSRTNSRWRRRRRRAPHYCDPAAPCPRRLPA